MAFHNSAQPYSRPLLNTRMRQQFPRQKVFTWSADRALLRCAGKILVISLPVVLALNVLFASWTTNMVSAVQEVDNTYRVLMDKQIKLRAQRAQLYSPEQIQLLAAEKFSLRVPGKEQVKLF